MTAAATDAPDDTRLLVLTPDFPPSRGGIQLLLGRLAENLERWDVTVVARPSGDTPYGSDEGVHRTWSRTGAVSLLELNLRSLVVGLRTRPRVVLNGHVMTTPAALAIAALLRVPVVTYLYADEIPTRPWLTRLALKHSARSVAISHYARDLAIGVQGDARGLVVVAPGVDQLDPSSRASGGPDRNAHLLVTVSRLAVRRKGHDVILEALRHVTTAVPNLVWVVIGDGPLRPELEAKAANMGLGAPVVQFVGPCTDTERDEWLGRAAAFVMPSRNPTDVRTGGGEGFGIVYLEAALHGVPSIAANVGGAPDAVVDGLTGLLVDPEDPTAVAGAIIELLQNPERARRLGDAARVRAETMTWAKMAREVDGVLEAAAVENGRRRRRPRSRPR